MATWREIARNHILLAIEKAKREKLDIKEAIDDAYPFTSRTCYPYKVWLEERKKVLADNGVEHCQKCAGSSNFNCKYCRDRSGGCLLCMKKKGAK